MVGGRHHLFGIREAHQPTAKHLRSGIQSPTQSLFIQAKMKDATDNDFSRIDGIKNRIGEDKFSHYAEPRVFALICAQEVTFSRSAS